MADTPSREELVANKTMLIIICYIGRDLIIRMHTHAHTYIYIYIYTQSIYNRYDDMVYN